MEESDASGRSDTARDRRLARLAARQHGVVSAAQLKVLGYSMRSVQRQAKLGRLHRLYHGVYAVGHTRLSVRARWLAAALACGPDAALSHHAAAALWGLRPNPTMHIDVTARGKHRHVGVRCHVTRSLPAEDRSVIDAIPVTSLERTLLDYAEIASPRQLIAALEAAQRMDHLHPRRLDSLSARSPGRCGAKALKRALAELHDEAPWTQSELERQFLELVRGTDLPQPQCNVVVAGHLVDAFWPEHRLVIEVDSYRFHRGRTAFENDRRKDAELQIAGYRVVRITQRRMVQDQRRLIRDLRRLLGGPGAL